VRRSLTPDICNQEGKGWLVSENRVKSTMQEARPSGAATDAPAANQNIGAASQPSRSGANSPQNLGGASADATGEQQQQQAHCLTGVPLGHTPFSWASQGATVPVGHTPFSWTGSGTATPKPPEAKKETEDFLQPSAHAPAAAATSTATSAPSPCCCGCDRASGAKDYICNQEEAQERQIRLSGGG
jgi:hypothetical protein